VVGPWISDIKIICERAVNNPVIVGELEILRARVRPYVFCATTSKGPLAVPPPPPPPPPPPLELDPPPLQATSASARQRQRAIGAYLAIQSPGLSRRFRFIVARPETRSSCLSFATFVELPKHRFELRNLPPIAEYGQEAKYRKRIDRQPNIWELAKMAHQSGTVEQFTAGMPSQS
jgi:hypothetical protein